MYTCSEHQNPNQLNSIAGTNTHTPSPFLLLVLLVPVIVKCTYISFVSSEVHYTQLLLGQSVLTRFVLYICNLHMADLNAVVGAFAQVPSYALAFMM